MTEALGGDTRDTHSTNNRDGRSMRAAVVLIIVAAVGTVLPIPAVQASDHVYYFHNDHLGTPQAMSDASGRKVWEAEYDPFGKATVNQDPDGDGQIVTNNLRFPRQYYDAETGLHYNYHRDYDPSTGRYLQPDPIGLEGGLNLYAYVEGNPVSSVDPTGEFAIVPVLIGIGAGYAFDYLVAKYKKEHCTCRDTPLGSAGNSALGGVLGVAGPFVSKPRGGIAGGGPSGTGTSLLSQLNHAAASRGIYSVATRNGITKILRKVPYAGAAVVGYELYDAFSCD
jgi:RHS repeat-associated protein